jgi:hypothetical protein
MLANLLAGSAFAQDLVSGNIQSIPFQTGVDSAEVILTNTSTHKQYAALSDSLGNFSFPSVSSGSYDVKVLAAGYVLYDGSKVGPISVSGNYNTLDVQLVKNIQLDPDYAAYYNNAWEMFASMMGSPYGQHTWSGVYRNFVPPTNAFLDSAAAPAGWAPWADSAAADITRGSLGKLTWNIQPSQVS